LAELGQLTADLRLDMVAQQRPAVLLGQFDLRPTLREARDAASPSPEIL
jgi:hypothetical protein